MKFIDRAKIFIQSGAGGAGCISFRRERGVPYGGPDGGDGGKGGSIVFITDPQKETLIDFQSKVHYKAEVGERGGGANCHGKNGNDIEISIPKGTQIWDEKREILFFDAVIEGERFTLAKGGKGGVGNAHFCTSTNQVPKIATAGEGGEELWIWLILKIFADIGYIGFPNAGKSSLLQRLTGSKTKVANYPFTTLHPELGALWRGDKKLIMADLPGIIERAHEGRGLGTEFLGHIERCKGILHMIDASVLNVKDSFLAVQYEIEQFSPELLKKKQIVVLNKIDLISQEELEGQIEELNTVSFNKVFPISCLNGEGLDLLLDELYSLI